jgi:hypothetical protein
MISQVLSVVAGGHEIPPRWPSIHLHRAPTLLCFMESLDTLLPSRCNSCPFCAVASSRLRCNSRQVEHVALLRLEGEILILSLLVLRGNDHRLTKIYFQSCFVYDLKINQHVVTVWIEAANNRFGLDATFVIFL